ncbi:hypothetical protein [Vibrio parahaemolyticus]|nr:hypothetical protein [Vibrio parahaemolyticus]
MTVRFGKQTNKKDSWISKKIMTSRVKNWCYVYFSYSKDYNLLVASVKSIIETELDHKNIYIFEDPESTFCKEERMALTSLGCKVEKHPLGQSPKNGNGIDTISAQAKAMLYAMDDSSSEFCAKVDSDTLFVKPLINNGFLANYDLIGTRVSYKGESDYIYGNIYIVSNRFAKSIAKNIYNETILPYLSYDASRYFAENRVIYELSDILGMHKKIYNHETGFVYNVDTISNARIAFSLKEKFFSGYGVFDSKFKTIHLWSSNELLKYYLERAKFPFYLELTKLNIKNSFKYIKHTMSKMIRK